ncbi:hypothetical protein L484_004184 [Morus notabilis]|uniref:Uncharacterized protein n=1 Tax=Morus notabilis TaxID=981085 RepID=W9R1B5_9ROSA|nr:hypothetical protein L484_004184 [Morus notabilis]
MSTSSRPGLRSAAKSFVTHLGCPRGSFYLCLVEDFKTLEKEKDLLQAILDEEKSDVVNDLLKMERPKFSFLEKEPATTKEEANDQYSEGRTQA